MKFTNCCYFSLNWLASNDGPSKLNWVILICSKVKPIQTYGPEFTLHFCKQQLIFKEKIVVGSPLKKFPT